jgi:hypothetical protein
MAALYFDGFMPNAEHESRYRDCRCKQYGMEKSPDGW